MLGEFNTLSYGMDLTKRNRINKLSLFKIYYIF